MGGGTCDMRKETTEMKEDKCLVVQFIFREPNR